VSPTGVAAESDEGGGLPVALVAVVLAAGAAAVVAVVRLRRP
jgi:hypothetical protein